jgi:putative ABC transport system permease protein
LPADFQFTLLGRVEVWTPLVFTPEEASNRRGGWVRALGRLQRGRTVEEARAELGVLARGLAAAYPDTNGNRGVRVLTLADEVRRHHDQGFLVPVLLAMVLCVLLVACVNVTNVMLARATARQHEMAVRLALGASRGRIVRQWLVEHALLFLVASALGTALAAYGTRWVTASIPFENRGYLRNFGELHIEPPVLLFTLVLGTACGLVFGWLPARMGARADVNADLREASARTVTSHAAGRLRGALVACQVALALGLLVGSALLVQTARNLTRVDLGFETRRPLLTFRLALDERQYPSDAAVLGFYERLEAELARRPGIAGAAAGCLVPFGHTGYSVEFLPEGEPEPAPKDRRQAAYNVVTAGYAPVMGLRLARGRFLDARDHAGAPRAAMISETLASRAFGAADPVGRRLRLGRTAPAAGDLWTIAGVVADVKNYETSDTSEMQIYVPLAQRPRRDMTVVVRGADAATAEALTAGAREVVAALDPAEPLSRVFTMEALVGQVTAPYTVMSSFVTFFGALTLLLAGVGVYGVVSYAFAQRIREIGIRIALGARRADVAALVLGQVRNLLGAGLLPGLALAWGLGRALKGILFGVTASDWRVYATACATLAGATLLAALVPALRAMRVDPVSALRHE